MKIITPLENESFAIYNSLTTEYVGGHGIVVLL